MKMRNPRHGVWLWGAILGVTTVAAVEPAGFNPVKIEDLTWDDTQQEALSRTARMALKMENIEWNHAQSEHFVYHFAKRPTAEQVASETETYYEAIKKDLQIDQDRWEIPAQIFIFENKASWTAFISKTGIDPWSGGVSSGNEIYLPLLPGAKIFSRTTIPHELTHLILGRFLRGRPPIWLNEGVAEQQAHKHFVAYNKLKGLTVLMPTTIVSAAQYVPLKELTAAGDYPSDTTKVHAFYTESLCLVQFLQESGSAMDFLDFLQTISGGAKFETALDRAYGGKYRTLEIFERKFKEVAIARTRIIRESGSTK